MSNRPDYEKHFLDLNAGYFAGLDYCWDPFAKEGNPTQATSVTLSSGASGGFGYDYYLDAMQILTW